MASDSISRAFDLLILKVAWDIPSGSPFSRDCSRSMRFSSFCRGTDSRSILPTSDHILAEHGAYSQGNNQPCSLFLHRLQLANRSLSISGCSAYLPLPYLIYLQRIAESCHIPALYEVFWRSLESSVTSLEEVLLGMNSQMWYQYWLFKSKEQRSW